MKTSKSKKDKKTDQSKKKSKIPRKPDGKIDWAKYNNMLAERGNIEVWIDKKDAKKWLSDKKNGKKGRQIIYSDDCIKIILTIRKVFHQKLRQVEKFIHNILSMMQLDYLSVPNYSTIGRRSGNLFFQLPKNEKEKVILILDSSGLKVFGEGEWKVRRHGFSKHRTWKKVHIGIDSDGEIRALVLSDNSSTDADETSNLLNQEQQPIIELYGDGGYDRRKVYQCASDINIKHIIIPPQKNAKIWQHGNFKSSPHPRDMNLRAIRKTTRKKWKVESGYHLRSLVEAVFWRWKSTFGDHLYARKFENQVAEANIMGSILNVMRNLGVPRNCMKTI